MRTALVILFMLMCPASYAQALNLTCNGATDNTAALQSAINTGKQVDLATTGTGPCMTKALTLVSNVHLDCHGLTLQLLPNTNAAMFTTANFATLKNSGMAYGAGFWQIRNCDLDGNVQGPNTAGDGLDIYGYQFLFENNTVHDFAGDGWWSQWSDTAGCPYMDGTTTVIRKGCMESNLRNNKFFHNGGWGMEWSGPHDSVLDTNWNFQNGQGGFHFLDGSLRISHMHNYGDGPYEFLFEGPLDDGNDLYGEGATVAQFRFQGAATDHGSIVHWLIASNCGSADGVQLAGPTATVSWITGAACTVNFIQGGSGYGGINLSGTLLGNVPLNANSTTNIHQDYNLNGCIAGLRTDSNGTYHC